MEMPPSALHPAWLPPGTEVGSWRVLSWEGHGVYGTVYRALPLHSASASPAALKLAVFPADPRFEREGELLRRLRHPCIPRLWDSGEWLHPNGTRYPCIIMEWVDGVTLYSWARQHPAFPAQVPTLLAQLARALQAVHAQGAVHRDVKGGNILVRRSDGRAVLMDFGSGLYPDASTLTPPAMYPGTPAYRSPESWLFELQGSRGTAARYSAGPADDLYALGVTAYRLLTGKYPTLPEPRQDPSGIWHQDAVLASDELATTEPQLRALVLRLLSVRPEERGTAAQLAEALEQLSGVPATPPPSRAVSAPVRKRPWRMGLAAAVASLLLATWAGWLSTARPVPGRSAQHATAQGAQQPDAGTAGLAEALASASTPSASGLPAPENIAEEDPPEPEEGQDQPDAKGRCPHKGQVALNGGCWITFPFSAEECEDKGGQIFNNTCYVAPASGKHKHKHKRLPTSGPTKNP